MKASVARIVVMLMFGAVAVCRADLSVGTWKFNAAKSKSTSTNPQTIRTDVRESTPDGSIKVKGTGQYADGSPYILSYTCKYDGTKCPTKSNRADSITLKRIDANSWTFELVNSKTKYHVIGKGVISSDGKTLTQTASGTDPEGKPISFTHVLEKQ